MKYFFVSLHTSSKSSGNAKVTPSKQVGFEAVSIFRCLVWGVWKEPGSKVDFELDMSPQNIVYIYVFVCLFTELSEWGLVSAVNVPSPLEWNQTSRFPILYFGGK